MVNVAPYSRRVRGMVIYFFNHGYKSCYTHIYVGLHLQLGVQHMLLSSVCKPWLAFLITRYFRTYHSICFWAGTSIKHELSYVWNNESICSIQIWCDAAFMLVEKKWQSMLRVIWKTKESLPFSIHTRCVVFWFCCLQYPIYNCLPIKLNYILHDIGYSTRPHCVCFHATYCKNKDFSPSFQLLSNFVFDSLHNY